MPCSRRGTLPEEAFSILFGHGVKLGNQLALNLLRECLDGWRFEQTAKTQLNPELVSQPGNQLGTQKGMAAKQEEIISHGNTINAEKRANDLRHLPFDQRPRGERRRSLQSI